MAIIEIKFQFRKDQTHSSENITLDGTRFRLDAYTNKADSSWYMDLFDSNDDPLVTGIAIATGLDLLFPYRYLAVPPGILFVNSLAGAPNDPVLDSFIQLEVALYYQTADEALTDETDF